MRLGIERERLFKIGADLGRGVTLAALLHAAPGAFESPKFFGQNSDRAYAAELDAPLSQEALYKEAIARYSYLLSKKDVLGLERYLLSDSYLSWQSAGPEPFKYLRKAEFLGLLRQALARGEPRCIGYVQSRRASSYQILFQNLSLGNHPEASGYSYLNLGIVPFQDGVSSLVGGVQEVSKRDLEKALKEVTPCNAVPTPVPVRRAPTPVPLPPFPDSLKKAKVVYLAGEGKQVAGEIYDRKNVYVANLDGTEEKQLTDDDNQKMDVKFMPNGRDIIYAEFEKGANSSGIVKLNVETGEKQFLTHGGADFCPSPDVDGTVKLHRMERGEEFGRSFENVYSVNTTTKKVEQITDDTIGSSEACPVPSPDGKQVAIATHVFASHGRHPSGIAIYEKNELKNFDRGKLPELFRGHRPKFWSPDGKWLYFDRINQYGHPQMYRFEVSSGKVESLAITGRFGTSLSPDGNWVIFGYQTGVRNSTVMAQEPGKYSETRELFKRDMIIHDLAVQPKVFVQGRNTIVLFPGLGSVIRNGRYTSDVFDEAIRVWKEEMDYEDDDILLASLAGWDFDANGRYRPRDQECDMLLKGQDFTSESVLQLLRDLNKKRPNSNLILPTHSMASTRVIHALQRIKEENLDIDVSRLRVVISHGPNQGIDKPGLDWLGGIWGGAMSADCNIKLGPVELPIPSSINFPALVELNQMWDQRQKRKKELEGLADWMKSKGGQIINLAHYRDGALGARTYLLPPMAFYGLFRLEGDDLAVMTQDFPGAVNIWRFYSIRDRGHRSYWNSDEGLPILMAAVGRQIGEKRGVSFPVPQGLRPKLS